MHLLYPTLFTHANQFLEEFHADASILALFVGECKQASSREVEQDPI